MSARAFTLLEIMIVIAKLLLSVTLGNRILKAIMLEQMIIDKEQEVIVAGYAATKSYAEKATGFKDHEAKVASIHHPHTHTSGMR